MRLIVRIVGICVLCLLSVFRSMADEKYEWGSLPLGGGGFVTAVIAHPTEQNLFYARTDVGGIYRWIESTKSWKPLTDFISVADQGLYGVEAIAVDPQKPEMLYALVGTSYYSNGKTAILISDDYGETFTVIDVTSKFKAHGNGDGRQMGERLAVDPKNSNVIYCGTRSNGLFKSTDGGRTWNSVSFPVTTTSNGVGINFVQFDESSSVSNGVTQKIYVGTAQTGNSIYVSTNGGNSWSAVSGQPTQYIPHRCAMKNGTLFVTYANGAGPGIGSAGGYVYKYNGSWTNISPSNNTSDYNYGGISIVGNRIVVTSVGCYKMQSWDGRCDWQTATWGDEIFVSDNLGSSWNAMFSNCKVTFDANSVPWVKDHAMHWTGCATLDPFDSKRCFFISGNGLFMSDNLSTNTFDLKFMVKGLEETVPLDMVSLPSGQVITVVGDYDGGLYMAQDGSYDVYPSTVHTPEMGTTHGIAASVDGSLVVRAGSKSSFVQYSTDKGRTWNYCSGGKEGSGHVAVSANGSIILHCPNSYNGYSYDGTGSTVYYSTNRGTSWTQCNGISINGAYPVADGANSNKFYITNGNTVYVSTDGGRNFSAKGSTGYTSYYKMRAVPGVEGDIWAPCGSNGLYRSTNSATSFSKLSSVASCDAVGFGKAAEGKTFPAVYIWGTVSGVTGLFRSDDAGSSWVRINDDLHQFGGPGNGQFVMGDMAVYGTVFMSTVGRGVICGVVDKVTDSKSPVMTGELIARNIVQNAFTVEWTQATDNVGVVGYEVYVGDETYTTTETSFAVEDLACRSEYVVRVRAYDEAGNFSDFLSGTFETIGTDAPQTTTQITYNVGDESTALTAEGENLRWYDAEKQLLTSAPVPQTDHVDEYVFYVSQTILGCESELVEISVSVVRKIETQTILLQKGWNLISLYVEPDDNKVMSVLTVDFSIIKNLDGFYYTWNDLHLQSLTTIQAGEGYLVYINEASQLTVEGTPLEHYITQLHSGWNLVGVPQKTSKAVSDLPSSVTQVKDLTDLPITELESGKAYFINVSADTTVEW